MNINALNKANIDNLTALWKAMGTRTSSPHTVGGLHLSSSWPNRCWLDWNATTDRTGELERTVATLSKDDIVPVWGHSTANPNVLEQLLRNNGFGVTFEQTAMYLEPSAAAGVRSQCVERISSPSSVAQWVNIASESFGYAIDTAVIQKLVLQANVQLLQMSSDGQPAATALLYTAANVVGVHQLGVAKQHQGKGIATALMRHIIELSNACAGSYTVLQASAEAESMYRRLGFKQQFMIRNYQLQV